MDEKASRPLRKREGDGPGIATAGTDLMLVLLLCLFLVRPTAAAEKYVGEMICSGTYLKMGIRVDGGTRRVAMFFSGDHGITTNKMLLSRLEWRNFVTLYGKAVAEANRLATGRKKDVGRMPGLWFEATNDPGIGHMVIITIQDTKRHTNRSVMMLGPGGCRDLNDLITQVNAWL